jgi:hypothetical protein
LAEENPDMLEYDLCLSDFFSYDDDEEVTLVSDFPIMGIASNDESKEIRFILKGADISVLEQSRDKIHRLLREKGI